MAMTASKVCCSFYYRSGVYCGNGSMQRTLVDEEVPTRVRLEAREVLFVL
jgi:hypothetical protein